MFSYTLRRIAQMIPTLIIISILVFLLVRLIPGDPAILIAGAEASPQTLETIREQLGLDRPIYEQYWIYVGDLARGDLGTSLRSRQPVADEIVSRFPATIELAIVATVIFTVVGILLGIAGAIYHNRWPDHSVRVASLLGISTPDFWLGVLLILLFANYLGILPVAGRGSWQQLVLPAATASLAGMGVVARLVRTSLLDVLSEDYVRTARAKGLHGWAVIQRHALRNAFIPALTLLGLEFGRMLGGLVVVETVFAWPGFGRLLVTSIQNRDYPVVQGTILIFAVMLLFVNLIVDLLVGFLDPRIRYD